MKINDHSLLYRGHYITPSLNGYQVLVTRKEYRNLLQATMAVDGLVMVNDASHCLAFDAKNFG